MPALSRHSLNRSEIDFSFDYHFSLTPKNADSVLKLYDSIKILSFFTDVTALRKPLKILKFKMYTNMGIKKGKTTYNKLLARMGCGDYKKWNTALFKTKYFL